MSYNKMTRERYEELQQPGNMNALCEHISAESGLQYSIVVQKFPMMVRMLTKKQAYIMKAHYMWKQSIMTIKFETGISNYTEIEKCIDRSTIKMVELCKLIVDVNNEQERGGNND